MQKFVSTHTALVKLQILHCVPQDLKCKVFLKYYEKWNICSWGANAPFSIILLKLLKCNNYFLENIWKFELFIENDAMF